MDHRRSLRRPSWLGLGITVLLAAACESPREVARAAGGSHDCRVPFESFRVETVVETTSGLLPAVRNPAHRDEAFGGAAKETIAGRGQLYRLNADGTGERCLTCDDSLGPLDASYHGSFTPDGEHIVFISTRDRAADANPGLLTLGGEVYIMGRDGSDPQRLTHLDGYARAPIVSFDGSAVHWTQVTRDNRWHLVFAPLLRDGGAFRLGDIQEARVLAGAGAGETAAFTRSLAWNEWKHPSPIGDWWTVGATYASTMNIDTYAVSPALGEARRLTSHPENEEFASWDPSGLGLVVQSGRDHQQIRQLLPLPTPPLFDDVMVIFGLLFVQTARGVPWGTDLYYLDDRGEGSMTLLVRGAADGFLTGPNAWLPDEDRQYFTMYRVGLANPDPSGSTLRKGFVEFEGRPDGVFTGPAGDRPAFLEAATIETLPLAVAPFDPEDVHESADRTLAGREGGEVEVSLRRRLDHRELGGSGTATFRAFDDGPYRIDGTTTLEYSVPSNLLETTMRFDADADFVDRDGIPYRVESHWSMQNLQVTITTRFERPGNVEQRTVTLDSSLFL